MFPEFHDAFRFVSEDPAGIYQLKVNNRTRCEQGVKYVQS